MLPSGSGSEAAKEEARLIEGVRLLDRLGVGRVPLEVRLKPNAQRLELVLDVVAKMDSEAAKKLPLLEQLAECFGLHASADRHAVVEAAAWQALAHKEMTLAFELTLRLVDGGHARAWALCEKLVSLGIAPPKKDAAALGRLLAHALAHCPPPRFGRLLSVWRRWRLLGALETVAASDDKTAADAAARWAAAVRAAAAERRRSDSNPDADGTADGAAPPPPLPPPPPPGAPTDAAAAPSERQRAAAEAWAEHGGGAGAGDDDDDAAAAAVAGAAVRASAAVAPSRALASCVDRPTAPRSGGYAALQSLIDGAVDADDVNEVSGSVPSACAARRWRCDATPGRAARPPPTPPAPRARRSPTPPGSDDAALAEAAERDGAADGDGGGGGVAPASVLTAEPRRYREIASELERAERLASLLPSLRPARFAAAREARIGYVLELAAKQSFDEAISLAASVGVDEWEVRLAAVQAALVVQLDGDGEAAAAAAREVVVQHDAQLLGQPTRFMGAIVETVWPKVQGLPLLPLALDLLVDCATKLRNHKGGKGKDGAPPPALLDHNAGVVAALHGVLRRLRIAAPAVDVRDVLVLTSAPADDAPAFARLAVAVAPAARRALRRAVGACRRRAPPRLVAPELAACVAAGGAAPPAAQREWGVGARGGAAPPRRRR